MRRKLFLLMMGLWTATSNVWALDHDLQLWSGMMFQGPIDSPHQIYVEVQPRFAPDISRLQTIIVRPAYVYQLTQNSSAWLGYGWAPLFEPRFRDEQRLWQQVLLHDDWGAHRVSLRMRLEERFIAHYPGLFRLRVLGRLTHPFWASSWEALVWNELFFHFNSISNVAQAGFDRNRFFLGVVSKLHEKMAIEMGYLAQVVFLPTPDLLTHNLVVYLTTRF